MRLRALRIVFTRALVSILLCGNFGCLSNRRGFSLNSDGHSLNAGLDPRGGKFALLPPPMWGVGGVLQDPNPEKIRNFDENSVGKTQKAVGKTKKPLEKPKSR